MDASGGNVTINLPSAAGLAALRYTFVRIDGSANTVTVNADNTEAVGADSSITLEGGDIRSAISDGVGEFHLESDNVYSSQAARGMVELATDAEVADLTDIQRVITPAGLNSVLQRSLTINGYQKLPGGLILQWGTATVAGESSATVILPISFPNNFFAAFATLKGSASIGNAVASAYASPIDNSSFTIVNDQYVSTPSSTAYWFAIGS